MTKLKDGVFYNVTKGPFKPPRWVVCGKDAGIPFRRAFRSELHARRLAMAPGITEAQLVSAH